MVVPIIPLIMFRHDSLHFGGVFSNNSNNCIRGPNEEVSYKERPGFNCRWVAEGRVANEIRGIFEGNGINWAY